MIIYLDRKFRSGSSRLLKDLRVTVMSFPRRCSGWGLQGRYVTVPPVSSYLAFSSLPRPEDRGGFLFCCTFLKVTFTGNCPAPSSYGARTFLTHGFSALVPAIIRSSSENKTIIIESPVFFYRFSGPFMAVKRIYRHFRQFAQKLVF